MESAIRHMIGSAAAIVALAGAVGGATPPFAPEPPPATIAAQTPQYWFGVAVEDLQPGVAEQLKLQPAQGVVVVTVFPGSPAEKAGIKPKDFLIEVNGKALTSQEDLARAANTIFQGKGGPSVPTSELVYLRAGDRHAVRVSPESRPADMRANGAERLQLPANTGAAQQAQFRNFNLSNGNSVQVGPGYRIDARSQEDFNMIRQAAGDGNPIILTTEKDAAGKITNTVNDGRNTYVVDPNEPENVPANLRPLVGRSFNNQAQMGTNGMGQFQAVPVNADRSRDQTASMDERLQRLEAQNAELKKELEELKDLLKANGAAANPAVPASANK